MTAARGNAATLNFWHLTKPKNMKRKISSATIYGLLLMLVVMGAVGIGFLIQHFRWVQEQRLVSRPLPHDDKEVPYVTTPHDVVDKMLDLCQISQDDIVYDLGCGDGRIVIAAAQKYGCRAIGYDIDEQLIELSKQNARLAGVEDLVEFHARDIYEVDISEADVVTLFLRSHLNLRLLPQLSTLKEGSRVVSHNFDMPGVPAEQHFTMETQEDDNFHEVYYWKTPLKLDPAFNPDPGTQEYDELIALMKQMDWPGVGQRLKQEAGGNGEK